MKELQSVTFLGLNEDGDEITATDILEPRNLNYLGKTLLLTSFCSSNPNLTLPENGHTVLCRLQRTGWFP